MEFYNKTKEAVIKEASTSLQGLSSKEATKRLERDGYNELKGKDRIPLWKLFLNTFKDPMVIVLLAVVFIQIFLGHATESLIIVIVLAVNSIISVVQTRKAESSLDSLRKISAPEAKVFRSGEKLTIPVRELVVGDVVLLEAGDFVPADGRIISSYALRVEEGMLTGESEAVEKTDNPIEGEVALGDRKNMVYSGALAVYGRGEFIVTATGNKTEIGKIAKLLETAEEKQTPLQQKLEVFSKKLGISILILCVAIFLIQVMRIYVEGNTQDLRTEIVYSFMFAIAIAVAAIPESLSSIVTIVLAIGTNKMAKQHAIMRNLPAVETLGSTSVICTDKTGTLTQNKMTVTDYFLAENKKDSFPNNPKNWTGDEEFLIKTAVLCNDSYINEEGSELGDPTETALIVFSNRNNQPYQELRDKFPRLAELPFDSDRKLMSTMHTIEGEKVMLTKGGPDVLFSICTKVFINGEIQPFSDDIRKMFKDQNEAFSNKALRVLAYAYKALPNDKKELDFQDEKDLILIGLTAMIDPPREAVYYSIDEAKKAGIKTVMITGDHKTTAKAIALEIGLMDEDGMALSGSELDSTSDEELDNILEKVSVYARVSPENKIRIVRAWQKKNKVIAMTGDGVNDAPALKQADIGIAMGSGTDVAKDASSMILTDDNFVSIISAVSIGRTIFDNIKKSIAYLFSGNLGAIIPIVFALIFHGVSPFTTLQLLFINLANDSIPAIAIGMEKTELGTMRRKPRSLKDGIFSDGLMQSVIIRGCLIGIATIISQFIGLAQSEEISVAMAFTTLIFARTIQTLSARSSTHTMFEVGFFSNLYAIGALFICFGLYSITVLPFTREIFSIPDGFGLNQWLISVSLSLGAILCIEIIKLIKRLTKKEEIKY